MVCFHWRRMWKGEVSSADARESTATKATSRADACTFAALDVSQEGRSVRHADGATSNRWLGANLR